ncbi:MAG: hypothetical protein D4R84_15870 [Rhodocyclaceae bacterium]|nr:MAG: hypothetical protein D4R84_15870 [Rhodocyclaceae bacterium]
MKSSVSSLAALSALLLAGCASVPTGPSVMALPGSGKNFEQFRGDDAECRQFAQHQIGGAGADQTGVDAGVRSAAVGTVVGAVAGAAIGGRDSAGVGAGTGLLIGSMAGSGAAQSSAYATQRNYDNAYVQCMYAKGQQVPVSGAMARSRAQAPAERAPAATSYPPPPPGNAPPPPPGYPPPPPPGYAPPGSAPR